MPHIRYSLALAALALPLLYPSEVRACGGTFCDGNTPVPMPVDQRGEDILFVQDGPEIEVHVRIEYEGEAENFAWLVPIQAVPEISVGSENLFAALSERTAPYWLRRSECSDPSSNWSMGFVPEEDLGGAPEVILQNTVGAFEVVVLQGGTAAEVIGFLDQNGYAQDPEAEPILQEYLDEGFLFAAVKLTADASVDSIHPLVFRFQGDEPCVPIRLTRIAAEQDMGIRVYFLGQQRWAPLNYQHVVLNPLAFPWSEVDEEQSQVSSEQNIAEYTELLTLAVDAAGGHAFTTDFADRSELVNNYWIYRPSWDETEFIGLDMIETIDEIDDQQLDTHPLIQPLLLEFMPPPDGVDPQQYWNDIEQMATREALEAWDSIAFAAALGERIIEPGFHAVELLETWPYLTRLHTTMSPHEMTVDPTFQPAPELGDVNNVLRASSHEYCHDEDAWTGVFTVPFEDRRLTVCLSDTRYQWPAQLQTHAALRIEQIPPVGPAHVLEDFTSEILAEHAAYQINIGCEIGSGPDEQSDDETGGPSVDNGDNGAGCACRSDELGSSTGVALGLFGLALLAGGRRRRRAHF